MRVRGRPGGSEWSVGMMAAMTRTKRWIRHGRMHTMCFGWFREAKIANFAHDVVERLSVATIPPKIQKKDRFARVGKGKLVWPLFKGVSIIAGSRESSYDDVRWWIRSLR
jgi:hypothetical protein